MNLIALDFGGSAVKGAIVDRMGQLVEKFSLPSRVHSFDEWFDRFEPQFQGFSTRYQLSGIAISICGAVDVDKGIVHGATMLPYIHDVDVISLFEQRFHLTTEIENDACCAALAESEFGDYASSKLFALVVIGSGIGGAIVNDGQIIKGHHLYGGEFGYSILHFEKGKPKVLSELGSTRALIYQAARALNVPRKSLTGIKVFEMYDANDPIIVEVVEQWIEYLAQGLFNLQYTIDPEYLIIGGAISARTDLVDMLSRKFEHFSSMMPYCHVWPKVVASRFGNDANLLGAVVHFHRRQK